MVEAFCWFYCLPFTHCDRGNKNYCCCDNSVHILSNRSTNYWAVSDMFGYNNLHHKPLGLRRALLLHFPIVGKPALHHEELRWDSVMKVKHITNAVHCSSSSNQPNVAATQYIKNNLPSCQGYISTVLYHLNSVTTRRHFLQSLAVEII